MAVLRAFPASRARMAIVTGYPATFPSDYDDEPITCRGLTEVQIRQSLLADARNHGLDLCLDEDLTSLLQPIAVGGRRVGNRLAIQPMEGCDAELDGSPGELTFRRFRRFGSGGTKLVWGEACACCSRRSGQSAAARHQ